MFFFYVRIWTDTECIIFFLAPSSHLFIPFSLLLSLSNIFFLVFTCLNDFPWYWKNICVKLLLMFLNHDLATAQTSTNQLLSQISCTVTIPVTPTQGLVNTIISVNVWGRRKMLLIHYFPYSSGKTNIFRFSVLHELLKTPFLDNLHGDLVY